MIDRESHRGAENRQLVTAIRVIHAESRQTYGSPRVHATLRAHGHRVGEHRVARLMRAHAIRAKMVKKWRATTDSAHAHPVAPNTLNRQFAVAAPDRVWAGDITYVWTEEGWLYLAVVLDLYSRRAIAWAMGSRLTEALAHEALTMALGHRQPAEGLLHHTDRGSQYAATAYRARLTTQGITVSMSRRANCWDNAVVESFFHTLKTELVHHRRYRTRARPSRTSLSGWKFSTTGPAVIRPSVIDPPPSSKRWRDGLNSVSMNSGEDHRYINDLKSFFGHEALTKAQSDLDRDLTHHGRGFEVWMRQIHPWLFTLRLYEYDHTITTGVRTPAIWPEPTQKLAGDAFIIFSLIGCMPEAVKAKYRRDLLTNQHNDFIFEITTAWHYPLEGFDIKSHEIH